MDPRVQSTRAQLQEQFDLSMICYQGRKISVDALNTIANWENQLGAVKATGSLEKAINEFKEKINSIKGAGGWGRDLSAMSLNNVATRCEQLFGILQGTDMPVTSQTHQSVNDLEPAIKKISEMWNHVLTVDLPKVNAVLKAKHIKLS